MTARTVTAIYRADVDRFISDTLKAKAAVTGFGKEIAGSSAKSRAAANDVAGASAKAGIAISAGLALAGKAAIDWESAWAGVTKTVDGSASQMAALEGELRNLATTLPATHEEIAGVAEAAGQLGVAREDIVGFTETMIAMGESTNLSADEAATSIAQISNVMGTLDREGAVGAERLGSTIVALGNAGASTEKDIVSMATRITGAGKLIGATESDVLALANAMSSVGIEAQLGGGVMSRVMQQINSAVIEGGESVEAFAKVAGVSADEFSSKWNSDPVAAIDMFVKGLSGITASGGDAVAALGDVGIKGTENTSVLLRLAGAGDILSESLTLGAQAWSENSALQEEAQKRYATTASQIKIARNNVKDAAIDFGAVLAPAIVKASDAVSGLAQMLADLPAPAQTAVTTVAGIGAAALLAVGGTIKLTTTVLDLKESLDAAGISGGKYARTLGVVGAAAAAAAAATALADLAGSRLASVFGANATGTEAATANILKGSTATADFATSLETATSAGSTFGSLLEKVSPAAGLFGGGVDSARESLTSYDTALAQLVASGNGDKASEFLKVAGVSAEEASRSLPAYAAALQEAANNQKLAGDSADGAATGITGVGDATAEASVTAEEYADALDKVQSAITMLGGGLRAEQQAIADSGEAFKAAQEAVKGTSAEREDALRNLSASYLEVSAAQVEMGRGAGEVGATMEANRAKFIKAATDMGINAVYAAELADAYGLIPADVQTLVSQIGAETAAEQVTDLSRVIKNDLTGKTVTIAEAGANPSMQRVLKLDASIFGLKGKQVEVKELGATASGDRVVKLNNKIYILRGKTVTVSETGASSAYSRVASLKSAIDALRSKSVTLTVGTVRTGNGSFNAGQFASGGAVFGAGTSTSDSIDAKLSHNEHVWTAREVEAVGGHAAVYAMRAAALAGGIPKFRDGGEVMSTSRATQYAARPAAMSLSPIVNVTTPAAAGSMVALFSDAQIDRIADRLGQSLYDSNVDSQNGSARNLAARRKAPL